MWSGFERRSCLKVNGNLAKIRDLTARLSSTILWEHDGDTGLRAGGKSIVISKVASNSNFGIATFRAQGGSIHDEHYHPMNEWIGIGKGKAIAHFKDKDVEVNQHEVLMIPKDVLHRMEYIGETEGWVVTMPKDEGF